MTLGYTHAMFTGNLRAYAQKVDKDTENSGNNNGMIDGREIEAFKSLVKKETGYDFDFSKLKQSGKKVIFIQDENNHWKYNSSMQLASIYAKNGASSQAINALNGGDPFAKNANKTAIVPFLDEVTFSICQEEVEKQEQEVSGRLLQKREDKKAAEKQELHEATKSDLEKAWDWFVGLFK